VDEIAALQGFRPGDLPGKAHVSRTQFGGMLGNSMAVPVLTEAFRAVMTSAGLVIK